MKAYYQLVLPVPDVRLPETARTASVKREVVQLLDLENNVVEQALRARREVDEGYGEYVSWLADTVMSFTTPDDANALHALAHSPISAGSAGARKLAGFGEPAVRWLVELTRSDITIDRENWYEILGDIVGLHKKGLVQRRLRDESVRQIKAVLMDGLVDVYPAVRVGAIHGARDVGDRDFLPMLEQLQRTDETRVGSHFFVREEAEKAIASIRAGSPRN